MGKVSDYRARLRGLADWDPYLLSESGLPGPRGNLELAQAVADEGDESLFRRYLSLRPAQSPAKSAMEFLPVCGAIGLGRLAAEGRCEVLPVLREHASDPRWRVREGVVLGLQRLGERDMERLLQEMEIWRKGNLLEKRAAAAALCEPKLLGQASKADKVLQILDEITTSLIMVNERKEEDFRVLKKGLAYCWSVAVVASPQRGKALMEKWLLHPDKDVRLIMRENLKKNHLSRLDASWVAACLEKTSP